MFQAEGPSITNEGNGMNEWSPEKFSFVTFPKAAWKCKPAGVSGPTVEFQCSTAPNWFWRTMQYLVLGLKWERI
jgi:hypothetical protein